MVDDPRQPPGLPPVHESWLPREHPLHRPRHGGRQRVALVCAVLFFLVPSVSWVFGARPHQIENRPLASFPSPSSGWGFFTGLGQWATDHLVFRGGAVQAADAISNGLFDEQFPLGQSSSDQAAGPLPGSTPATNQPTTMPGPQVGPGSDTGNNAGYTEVIQGKNGWLYLGQDVTAKCLPAHPLSQTINAINALRQAVVASGRSFVFVIPPDKSTMEPQNLPDSYAGKSCATAVSGPFWQAVTNQAGAMDLRPDLSKVQRRIGAPVYYPLDTHWTDEGALVMARDVAENLQPGVTSTWKTELIGTRTAAADLPPLIGQSEQRKGNVYALAPSGQGDRTQSLAGSISVAPQQMTSAPETGTYNAPVTVLGDSFTEASASYLGAAFSKLTMVNYSLIDTNQQAVLNSLVNSKVVVLEAVERVVADGNGEFLGDGFVKALTALLAAHPMR
jgi:alginate O-acetyltransferase complex protein AlgJ